MFLYFAKIQNIKGQLDHEACLILPSLSPRKWLKLKVKSDQSIYLFIDYSFHHMDLQLTCSLFGDDQLNWTDFTLSWQTSR